MSNPTSSSELPAKSQAVFKGRKIMYCGCKADKNGIRDGAEFQDNLYGEGRRLHKLGMKSGEFHCTICGKSVKPD